MRWNTYADRVEDPASFQAAADYVLKHLAPGSRLWVVFQPAYQGRQMNIDYDDVMARFSRFFDERFVYLPRHAIVYENKDPRADDYRGLESVRLVVFERQYGPLL